MRRVSATNGLPAPIRGQRWVVARKASECDREAGRASCKEQINPGDVYAEGYWHPELKAKEKYCRKCAGADRAGKATP